MNLNLDYGVAGYFDVDIRDSEGNTRRVQNNVRNLITNTGLDRLGQSTAFGTILAVGSGSTPPAITNTSLVALVSSASATLATNAEVAAANRTITCTYTCTFSAGAAQGNLTEIGLGSSTTTLSTRALFLDGSGNPTTITVGAADQLIVTYKIVFTLPDLATQTLVESASGTSYSVTYGASAFSSPSSSVVQSGLSNTPMNLLGSTGLGTATVFSGSVTFGGVLVAPSGGTSASISNWTVTSGSYVAGSYSISQTFAVGLTSMNGTGFNAIATSATALIPWKFYFNPTFSKSSSQTFSISLTYTWSRT